MVRTAVFNFCFFVLGVVLGVLLAPPRAGNELDPAAGFREQPVAAARPAPRVEPAAKDAAAVSEDSPLPEGANEMVAKILASIPAPAVASGSGAITGVVRTEDGAPVGGVLVRGVQTRRYEGPARRFKKDREPGDAEIERQVYAMIESHKQREVTAVEAHTAADGAFVLERLADSPYSVAAYMKGYSFQPLQGQNVHNVKAGGTVEFVARPLVEVAVNVLLPDGSRAAKATINYDQGSENFRYGSGEQWVADDPVIQIHPGTYTLRAVATEGEMSEGEEYRSDPQEVAIAAGVQPPALTFQLKGRPGIKGKLIFPKGEEIRSPNVTVVRSPDGSLPSIQKIREESMRGRRLSFEGPGFNAPSSFSFTDLAAGTYALVYLRTYQGPIAAAELVEVKDSTVFKDLVVPPLERGEYTIVWVYGPNGEVLRDVNLSTRYQSKGGSGGGGGESIRRPDGSSWVLNPVINQQDESAGEDAHYYIVANSSRYGQKEAEYRPGESSEVTIQFSEPAVLDVSISGYVGSGQEGAISLSLRKQRDDEGMEGRYYGSSFGFEQLNAEGRQTFQKIEPGAYDLVVSVNTEGHQSLVWDRIPVTLKPGKNALAVPMPPLYPLTVTCEDAAADTRLSLGRLSVDGETASSSHRLDGEGRTQFTRLPPGDYVVRTYGSKGVGEMRVTLPGPNEIRFEASPHTAYFVQLRSKTGYLAAAGLQAGDMIIGVDGEEFANEDALRALRGAAADGAEKTLIVVRGGQRLAIAVDPKKLRDSKELGGYLREIPR